MSPSQPVVSIVLPTYNRAHLIGETIQSVMAQNFTDWELIIVDDGSADNTAGVVQELKDSRIHFFSIPHTGRLDKVRNVGISKSKGSFIAFLDSDDLWRNDKLQVQLTLLNQFPNTDFIFSNGDQFGEGAIHPPDCDPLFVGNVFLLQLVYNRFCFYAPSLMFKKSIIDTVGLLTELGDIHFFYCASYNFNGIFTNERLVKIRKHSGNTSTRSGNEPYLLGLRILEEFLQKKMLSHSQYKLLVSETYYKMALLHFHNKELREALAGFWSYVNLNPFDWKGWIRICQVIISSLR